MKNNVDIAIIGGGIVGAVIARELIKTNPKLSLSLIEKKILGAGVSFYSAGVHFPRGNNENIRRMSRYSHDYYQKLINLDMPLYSLPMEIIINKKNNCEILNDYLALAELKLIDLPYNKEIDMSLLRSFNTFQGKGSHYVDVFNLVNIFLSELRSKIHIYEGTRVVNLQKLSDGYQLQLSTNEQLKATKVILAPGVWLTEPAWNEYVMALGIRIKKIVATHIEQVPSQHEPLLIFHDDDAFLLPCFNRQHLLFSYTCQEWDVDPENINALLPNDLIIAREILSKYSPSLAQKIRSGRVFCDAYSKNREPIIVSLDKNLIFAGGTNGSGYRLAPSIAAEVVKLL